MKKYIEHYMKRCFELASNGLGKVAPNPMVGCVLVCENKIIGEGYHKGYGQLHAEANAIKNAEINFPSLISNSELYVNLEPCNHYGKTPPCTDLIIQKGIKKVIISNSDPNPIVSGSGIKKLKENGIDVLVDILPMEGKKLNSRFFTFYNKNRPFIILKWAQTADNFIAQEHNKRIEISGPQSHQLVHKWRTEEDSILVGKETARIDNPQLNPRLWTGKNPIRLLIDRDLSLPENLNLYDQQIPTIIFNSVKEEQNLKTSWVKLNFSSNIIPQLLSFLHDKKIQSIIVEGGAYTIQKFIDENLWDEARIFTSNMHFIKGIKAPSFFKNTYLESEQESGEDILKIIKNNLQ